MSVTAVGLTSTLDAARPVAPAYGLLSVPGVLSPEERGRWLNGVNLYGYPHGDTWTWDPCSAGTFRLKSAESEVNSERFDPFGIGMSFVCSTLGLSDDWDDRLRAAFDARLSFMVERAVSQGSDVTSNGWLGDTNMTDVTPTPGTPVSPAVGLRALENAIGQTGLRGIIHAASPVVAAWGFEKLRVVGDHLETANGNFVAAGGGYIGADPASGDTPEDEEAWVFATTGLEVRRSVTEIPDLPSSLDRSINEVVARAEATVLATWDHEVLQAGVLVDWATA